LISFNKKIFKEKPILQYQHSNVNFIKKKPKGNFFIIKKFKKSQKYEVFLDPFLQLLFIKTLKNILEVVLKQNFGTNIFISLHLQRWLT